MGIYESTGKKNPIKQSLWYTKIFSVPGIRQRETTDGAFPKSFIVIAHASVVNSPRKNFETAMIGQTLSPSPTQVNEVVTFLAQVQPNSSSSRLHGTKLSKSRISLPFKEPFSWTLTKVREETKCCPLRIAFGVLTILLAEWSFSKWMVVWSHMPDWKAFLSECCVWTRF